MTIGSLNKPTKKLPIIYKILFGGWVVTVVLLIGALATSSSQAWYIFTGFTLAMVLGVIILAFVTVIRMISNRSK